jgi:hypothetical protein
MPRAGDAFLNGDLPLTHDPLGRIDYHPNGPVVDLQAFIDAVTSFLSDTIFPIIKDITGIDLSGPEAFLASIINVLLTGGPIVQNFGNTVIDIFTQILSIGPLQEVLPAIVAAFEGITMVPGAILGGIQAAIQKIIDAVVGAITGTASQFNDITAIVGSLFNPMQLIQNVFGLVQSLADQLGGMSGGLDARLSALEAAALGASGLVSGDNFNRAAIGASWTDIAGTLVIGASDYVKSGFFSAGYYNVGKPSTDRYGVAVKLAARTPGDCAFFAFSDTTMSNYVGVRIHAGIFGDDSIALYTGSSPTVSVVHTQADFVSNFFGHNSLNEGDVIALNYDDVTNTYKVSRNGAVIDGLTWTDDTNIITHGVSKRENGIVSNVLNQTLLPGFGVTDFVYYDRSTT